MILDMRSIQVNSRTSLLCDTALGANNTDSRKGPPVHKVNDLAIPVSQPAGEITIRVYTPIGSGPFPVHVNFHGGELFQPCLNFQDTNISQVDGFWGVWNQKLHGAAIFATKSKSLLLT